MGRTASLGVAAGVSRPEPSVGVPIDLTSGSGRAVLWGIASEDLNVNLVSWPSGGGVDEHTNTARDVLVIVTSGQLAITIDDHRHALASQECIIIPKGSKRVLRAGNDGVRYLTVHWRRPPMTVDPPQR